MKNTGRIYFDPVHTPKHRRPAFRVSRLKDLSERQILSLMRSIVSEMEDNRLFLTDSQMKGLRKRLQDLAGEMCDRIKELEYLASIDESPSEIEAFRLTELNPPRKALARSYVRGSRLKPGRKREYRRSRRKVA